MDTEQTSKNIITYVGKLFQIVGLKQDNEF